MSKANLCERRTCEKFQITVCLTDSKFSWQRRSRRHIGEVSFRVVVDVLAFYEKWKFGMQNKTRNKLRHSRELMLLIAQLIYFHLFQFEISSADCSLQSVTFIIPANDSTIFSLNLISNRPLMFKFFHQMRGIVPCFYGDYWDVSRVFQFRFVQWH